jgi:hypothetical protein
MFEAGRGSCLEAAVCDDPDGPPKKPLGRLLGHVMRVHGHSEALACLVTSCHVRLAGLGSEPVGFDAVGHLYNPMTRVG